MSNTMLSILTMYRWDETLFDNMTIPAELDKELLVDNLVIELAEFEIVYSEWDFLKFAIDRWSARENSVWEKLYATTILDYNPIENYNRVENMTDLETRNLSGSDLETRDLAGTDNQIRDLAGTDNETRDLASTVNDTTVLDGEVNRSGDNTKLDSTSAFDNNTPGTFTDRNKEVSTQGTKDETDTTTTTTANATDTGTDNRSMTDTGTVNNSKTDTGTVNHAKTDTGTVNNTRSGSITGNIGVTTTQQMIEQERESVKFEIYDYIIQSFKNKFCITVY